ncbi:MAG: type II toxin-antitoxin system RelE family toxin [Halobacteriota archaeon]
MKPEGYEVKLLDPVTSQLELDKTRNPRIYKIVKTAAEKCKTHPFRPKQSKKLRGDTLEKFWRWKPNGIRIIYQVCGYCRKMGYYDVLQKVCPICEFPDNTVIFFYYGPRNDKKVYNDFEKMASTLIGSSITGYE